MDPHDKYETSASRMSARMRTFFASSFSLKTPAPGFIMSSRQPRIMSTCACCRSVFPAKPAGKVSNAFTVKFRVQACHKRACLESVLDTGMSFHSFIVSTAPEHSKTRVFSGCVFWVRLRCSFFAFRMNRSVRTCVGPNGKRSDLITPERFKYNGTQYRLAARIRFR